MMTEDQTYQLIENYLNGELSGEVLHAFEKELGQNSELRKKTEAHKLANEMVIEYRLQNVQSILHEEKIKYGRTSLWKKVISGITGGLILASLLFFFINKDNPVKNESIQIEKSSEILKTEPVPADTKEQNNKKSSGKNPNQQLAIDENPDEKNKTLISSDSIIIEPNNKQTEIHTSNNQDANFNEVQIQHKNPSGFSSPCDHIDITSQINVKPTCEGETNGSITITAFKGGTAPYQYYVSQNNNELNHSNLSAGIYTVLIKDSKGCSKNIPDIEVFEKHCLKDYSFNPSLGETWEIPSYKNSGTLILYDEGGIVYFTEEIGAGEKQQWSGQSKNGEVKTGYFLFVINYKDGTSRQGSVTIVR
jgi:hypothetical protein